MAARAHGDGFPILTPVRADGRPGVVMGVDPKKGLRLVEFEDGSEEWVPLGDLRARARTKGDGS